MRTVEEIREELDDVIAAMRAIARGAQSYQIGSRSVTKADLAQLRAWSHDLETELSAAQQGGTVTYMGWDGR